MPEVRVRDEMSCDFCSSPEPRWLFRARNYVMQEAPGVAGALGPLQNQGGWLACHQCAAFVGRNDWNGLVRRVTANGGINPTIRAAMDLGIEEIEALLKRTWKNFAANRVGGAIEWRP